VIVPLSSAQATDWGFTWIGSPTIERNYDPFHETIQLSGAGTFDPGTRTASGGGAFTIYNAFDDAELGGPIFYGTWKATDVISWQPDGGPNPGLQGGILKVHINLTFTAGLKHEFKGLTDTGVTLIIICPFVNGQFVESGDAINIDYLGFEVFATNPTGLTSFHIKRP
jgi:hypothetical protein